MENCLDKLSVSKEKIEKYQEIVSRYTFGLALFIELSIVILEKSEYIIQYEGWWFRITFVLFGISLITTKRKIKEWIWLAVFSVVGVISYRVTERNEILRWIVFIWSCQGKDMKKVFKFTFWYTAIGCAIIFLLSVTGIYGTVAYTAVYRTQEAWVAGVEETRYCFGMGHPNAFHCMMLVLTWLGIYCYYEKIKWYGYVLLSALHVILYFFTVSRTGLLMSAGSLLVFIILRYWKKLQSCKWSYILGILIVIGMVSFSVFMAKYSVHHPFLKKIDGLLSQRITNLYYDNTYHAGMLNTWYPWSSVENTKYFDLGIIRMFYWFGIIPGTLYFLAQCRLLWCGYKKKDYMMLAMVVVITIYSVFEAHFISDYMGRNYILFFFGMYLSNLIGEKGN